MEELNYSIVLANPVTGESSVLCHGATREEAEDVVAALAPVYPGLRFEILVAGAWRDFALTRSAG